MFIQFLFNGIVTGLLYALAALGFALVYNTTRVFHLAYSALYVLSQYLLYSFFHYCAIPLIPAILLAVILVAGSSLAMELLVYRPLANKKASPNSVLISSIGITIIVINCIALFFGSQTKVLIGDAYRTFHLGSLIFTANQLVQLAGCLILLAALYAFINGSGLGLRIRAMRDDEELLQLYGFDLGKMRTIVFLISGAVVAFAGAFQAIDLGMDPYTGMPLLFNAFICLVIGGMGQFRACILGGLLIGIVQALTVWQFSSEWSSAITFGLLLVFLLLRPQGILGQSKRNV